MFANCPLLGNKGCPHCSVVSLDTDILVCNHKNAKRVNGWSFVKDQPYCPMNPPKTLKKFIKTFTDRYGRKRRIE